MHGKRLLCRMYAKHRAARYTKKQKLRNLWKGKKQMAAIGCLLIGAGVLYCRELPLLCLPERGYERMKNSAMLRVQNAEEEELLSIQYAGAPGTYLTVRHADGAIPVFLPPEKEAEPVSVRDILEERFGPLEQIAFGSFLSNYYIEDMSTKATEDMLNPILLAEYPLQMEQKEEPQILIFHTHASEGYLDSREGMTEDTVVGAGSLLAEILRKEYGYNVIHETTVFDRKADGSDDRNNAYSNALPVITAILDKYPSIEVVIDLHRDSGEARTSVLNGVNTAKVMLFNGLCRTKDGPITYYSNQNLTGNLAFSLHLQITGNERYPGLMHRIYLKSYRYNMHLKEKYLLVELGTHKNTVAEAKAAMRPFAETLAAVLSGK